MLVQKYSLFRWLSLVLLFFLVAACAEDDSAGSEMESARNARPRPIDAIDEEEQTDLLDPADVAGRGLTALDGELVIQQGDDLYVFEDIAEGQTQQLGEDLLPDTVRLSPDRRHLLYVGGPADNPGIYSLDAFTRSSRRLAAVSPRWHAPAWQVAGWSPDGQWAVLDYNWLEVALARLDGRETYIIEQMPGNYVPVWLDDGSVMLIEWGYEGNANNQAFAYLNAFHYDPAGDVVEEWGFSLQADPPWEMKLDEHPVVRRLASEKGYGVIPTPDSTVPDVLPPTGTIVAPEAFAGPATPCLEWQIVNRDNPAEVLYRSTDTFMLSDLQGLPGGAMLFLEWRMPDCALGYPEISLRRLHSDGVAERLTDDIFPGTNKYEPDLSIRRYLLTPGGDYAVWLGGHPEAGESSLNVTHLASGVTEAILSETQSGTAEDFNRQQLIQALYLLQS